MDALLPASSFVAQRASFCPPTLDLHTFTKFGQQGAGRIMRAWATLCRSLSRAGFVAHTSVSLLFGLGPRCYLALASLAPRIRLLRSHVLPGGGDGDGGVSREELSAYGVDCSCYFTDNIYVKSPVEAHFDFHDLARFEQEYAEVLSPLSPRWKDPSPSGGEGEGPVSLRDLSAYTEEPVRPGGVRVRDRP